jgi:FkbM family methyltransferase
MGYRRALIRLLDRTVARRVLSALINLQARRCAPGVRVYYNRGMWMHQESGVIYVDSPTMDYHPVIFPTWANELNRAVASVADTWFHVYQPRPGDLIVDAGAGKGEDTIVFSRAVGPTGKVLSIEAHPTTFHCLRLFCELNHLQNVAPANFALIDSARPVAIENLEGWHANRIVDSNTKGSLQVAGLGLDELIQTENVQRIDFLKMNIEGAEAMAIRGMDRTLRITSALCIACHDFRTDDGEGEFFRTRQLIQGCVQRAGFRTISRASDPRPDVACQVNAVRD